MGVVHNQSSVEMAGFFCVLLVSLWAVSAQNEPCNFSRDCRQYRNCQNIADASCACVYGKCEIRGGNPFQRGLECSKYTDCSCRNQKLNCSCNGGYCQTDPVECQTSRDCNRLDKCKGKRCNCSGNLCEWHCDSNRDCKDHYCNETPGYRCECKKSLCDFVKTN